MSFTNIASILFASILLFLVSCSEEQPQTTVNKPNTVTDSVNAGPQKEPPIKNQPLSKIPVAATIQTKQFKTLKSGDPFVFQETNGEPIIITINKYRTDAKGTAFLSGTHIGARGTYQLTATAGNTVTYGRIQTPNTTYSFTVENGKTTIVDLRGPNNQIVPKDPNDAKIPTLKKEYANVNSNIPQDSIPIKENAPPAVDGKTTIDLMIVYSNGFAAEHPGDTLMTRLDYLVSLANTLYSNSNVNIYLRLVHTVQVTYPDNTDNNSALDNLTDGVGVFEGMEDLRQLHGADLVSFIRPYDSATQDGCGIAWVLGTSLSNYIFYGDHGYSVISDGSEQIDNITYYCSEQTLAHELGHNMGSTHDRANTSSAGAYSYSYGYGINNSFGTVMSYISPEIDYFSNPDITCDAGPPTVACGIDEAQADSANNTLSLNNAAAYIAGFLPAKYSADINGDGLTDITDTVKSLMILNGISVSGSVDSMQDVNGDGRLGLAEAIHSLQQSQN